MTAVLTSSLETRLHDLCSAIATDPEVAAAREKAETFLADEAAVGLYRQMATMGRELEERDQMGSPISQAEMEKFEALQDQVEGHELIRGFSEAQQILQGVANKVNAYVSKTLEKGRAPTSEEMADGGCGAGCGCHH